MAAFDVHCDRRLNFCRESYEIFNLCVDVATTEIQTYVCSLNEPLLLPNTRFVMKERLTIILLSFFPRQRSSPCMPLGHRLPIRNGMDLAAIFLFEINFVRGNSSS